MAILEVNNLVKKFGGLVAVNDVSFSLNESDIIGLSSAAVTATPAELVFHPILF